MIKILSYVLRHSAEVCYDSEDFVRLSELMGVKSSIVNSLLYPFKIACRYICQSNTTFSGVFPVYRAIGTNRKQYVMPDISLRAVQ